MGVPPSPVIALALAVTIQCRVAKIMTQLDMRGESEDLTGSKSRRS